MHKYKWLFLPLLFIFMNICYAQSQCFIVMDENNRVLEKDGDCATRHTPGSTFKIAISLMGYNEGILIDTTHPVYPFKKGYPDYLPSWKEPQNPSTWIKNSCVWYAQLITQQLGMSTFQKYVTAFDYGNEDVSGDKGKNNGLTHAWLSSSLQISPQEQLAFLQKMLQGKLPVNEKSVQLTKQLLFIENIADGWKLYGTTGSGYRVNAADPSDESKPIGWFVGWLQRSDRTVFFSQSIEEDKPGDIPLGLKAKAELYSKMDLVTGEDFR